MLIACNGASERVGECCLTTTQQLFSYIMAMLVMEHTDNGYISL